MDDAELSNSLQTALRAGGALTEPKAIALPNGGLGFIVPAGYDIKKIDALDTPLTRIRATPRMDDAESFVAYVNRFKTDATIIFADLKTNLMTAVIDYHHESTSASASSEGPGPKDTPGRPDYTVHRVAHPCPWSVEWARWRAIDGQNRKQAELGLFLEEMLHTIAAPEGATLLEIAAELRVEREVKFKSGNRLANGTVAIAYEEIDETKGSKGGKITVPEEITIVSPVFMGGEPRGFKAKLRYRLDRGELTFKIDILNRVIGEQQAFENVCLEVGGATGRPVFYGAA